jgi:hypothetical protein
MCRCFTATPTEGYPRGGEFVGRVSPRSRTRRCKGTQGLDRFGHREHNTLCPVWFVLPLVVIDPEGVPVRPFIVWGDRFIWKS